jgi:hypothetical protein
MATWLDTLWSETFCFERVLNDDRAKLLLKVAVFLLMNHKTVGLPFSTSYSEFLLADSRSYTITPILFMRHPRGETHLATVTGKLTSSKSDMKLVAWQCCQHFSNEETVIRNSLMSHTRKWKKCVPNNYFARVCKDINIMKKCVPNNFARVCKDIKALPSAGSRRKFNYFVAVFLQTFAASKKDYSTPFCAVLNGKWYVCY